MRAEEKGIPLEQVNASGPDGLIIERDVLRAGLSREYRHDGPRPSPVRELAKSGKTAPPESRLNGQPGRWVALTAMRTAIARHLKESLSIAAQANHRMDADFSEAARLRKQLQEGGLAISFTDLIVKATAHALRALPPMNSTWTDGGLFIYQDVNIGIAVALEDGLVVPVLKNADRLSLRAVHERSVELAERAREGKLNPSDQEGGTFTITNLGMYDVESFTAIINQPQSGILAVGKISDRPVVARGEIAIRPLATLSLTYDHRVIDGAPAAQFLKIVRNNIENPLLFAL
jgi:pyruvate dehydrogenase E2 component (dihydrolipoamide acetyltransferase)